MTVRKIYILLYFSIIAFLYSGTDGTIRGKVLNMEGEALIGAQIYIESLGIGAVADFDGNYIILNVPVGEYDLKVDMISYKSFVMQNVDVIMDKTVWLNFNLEVAAIEGETIYVSGEKELVEKGSTAKKVTIGSEAIEALPIRDVSELYTLQSGVVKVEGGMRGAIPDHEERGLEEVHVRGGRTGEIAYMIDGLYIRNPIFGGIGSGTRLNLFAIKEFDFQPGGFNAEYGDAMSAVSNLHTASGGDEFSYKLKYETSGVGAVSGNMYDQLRGYNDYNFGFGTPLLTQKLRLWISGQYTDNQHYRVYDFDDLYYIENDPNNDQNRENLVQPWDNEGGLRGFGFDRTWDVFGKLTFKLTNKIKTNFSYWKVAAHRKGFGIDLYGDTPFLYWDEGQNELFRDTERFTFDLNHSIDSRTFYSLRVSHFVQEQFQGVRWMDSDEDGYPDWFEWSNPAGENRVLNWITGAGNYSDPYDSLIVPYNLSNVGDTIQYINRDGEGPHNWTSGWYYGAAPGNYNWQTADEFDDLNNNQIYDFGEPITNDRDGDGQWDGPSMLDAAIYRDGSYWLTPEMYVDYKDFYDLGGSRILSELSNDPYFGFHQDELLAYIWGDPDSLYFFPQRTYWYEEKTFGGHDKFFGTSRAVTSEVKLDITSQLTSEWRARIGIDLKSHKLNFNEIKYPWLDEEAIRQRFAEQWEDYGIDGIYYLEDTVSTNGQVAQSPDYGEGNGVWDGPATIDGISFPGETFYDFNGNDSWDDYVEPMEVSLYFQNTYEVPWFVINAGIRLDLVNYNTKSWADDKGNYSPNKPWFWQDCGRDGICPDSYQYSGPDEDGTEDDGQYQPWSDFALDPLDPRHNNGQCDEGEGECVTDNIGENLAVVFFSESDWFSKISPRVGFSHIITDQSTFTFNYGVYHQTPIFENIYLNTSSLEDPEELFEKTEANANIGNSTMTAARTQSYEFAFNVQVGNHWAYSIGSWVKKMDQLTTAKTYRSGVYEYQVSANGDYGTATGIDLMLENKGLTFNTMVQYTYSKAVANGEYDQAAFGEEYIDTPSQQFLMPYDRPHDLSVTLFTDELPFGLDGSLTGFYQSGLPYTPLIKKGKSYGYDYKNKNTKRSPSFKQINISLTKSIELKNYHISMGLNVYNLFDISNALDIYPLTGKSDDPGDYYTDEIGLPANGGFLSSGYYDRPWYYSSPREINFLIQIDYK